MTNLKFPELTGDPVKGLLTIVQAQSKEMEGWLVLLREYNLKELYSDVQHLKKRSQEDDNLYTKNFMEFENKFNERLEKFESKTDKAINRIEESNKMVLDAYKEAGIIIKWVKRVLAATTAVLAFVGLAKGLK